MISGLHFFIFRRKLTIRSSSQRQYKDWMRWLRYPHVNLRLTRASRNRAEQFKLLWVFQSAKVRCLSANLCGLLETHILGLFGSPLLCTLQLPLPCTLLPPLRTALLPVASSGKKKKKTFKTCKIQLKIHHKKNHSVTFMENWHSGEWRGRGIIPAISTTLKEIVALLHCFFFFCSISLFPSLTTLFVLLFLHLPHPFSLPFTFKNQTSMVDHTEKVSPLSPKDTQK